MLDAAEGEDLRHPAGLDQMTESVEHLDRRVGLDRAGEDAASDDAAEIGIGLEQRAEHAEAAGADLGRLDVLEHQVEQRRHVLFRPVGRIRHPALLGRAVDDREVELLVGGVERGEQVEALVDDFARPRVGLVDLVDADDRPQADLQRLADDELGLRHRPFGGVDQHDRAVDHRQDALDLAAEIGVAGRVDDVDAHVLPHHRGRLGEDGDAALALEVVGVHHPLGDALVLAEGAGLLQQPIDQRRLAVVDVGDDGDVSQLHAGPGFRRGANRKRRRQAALSLDGRCDGSATKRAPVKPRFRFCGAIHERRAKGKGGATPRFQRGGGAARLKNETGSRIGNDHDKNDALPHPQRSARRPPVRRRRPADRVGSRQFQLGARLLPPARGSARPTPPHRRNRSARPRADRERQRRRRLSVARPRARAGGDRRQFRPRPGGVRRLEPRRPHSARGGERSAAGARLRDFWRAAGRLSAGDGGCVPAQSGDGGGVLGRR